MTQQNRVTKKQEEVLNDLFKGDRSEIEVLKKYKVSAAFYRKWFDDEVFADEFSFRMEAGKRQCELIIANYAPVAAAKLIGLTECEKEETMRKACLDIISSPLAVTQKKEKKASGSKAVKDISHEKASVILEALANDCDK
jgi:hypothetical protein